MLLADGWFSRHIGISSKDKNTHTTPGWICEMFHDIEILIGLFSSTTSCIDAESWIMTLIFLANWDLPYRFPINHNVWTDNKICYWNFTMLTQFITFVNFMNPNGFQQRLEYGQHGRDITIQLFWIHDSIQIQRKGLDSIQIQFFKMLIASKLNSRFNSTINISS